MPRTSNSIRWASRTTRRYEHDHPGDLIHVDINKLGKSPDGGGWRVHGRIKGGRNSRLTTTMRFRYMPVIGGAWVGPADGVVRGH